MKRIWELISTASHSRTTALLVILVIGAAIPLTVLVAQKQQEVRQQASGGILSLEACAFAIGAVCIPDTLNLQPGAVSFRLHWNIRDDTNSFQSPNCIASGGWSGTKTVTDIGGGLLGHNEVLPVPSTTTTYRLDCIGLGARALNDSVTVVPSPGGGGGSTIEQCNITHLGQNCKADPQASVCLNNLKGKSDCVSRYTAYLACITPNTGPGIIEEQANAFCGSGGNVGGQPPPSAGESCGPTDNLRCSGSQVQQCQDDGIWKTVSDCASFGQVCKAITGTVAACSSATPPTPACDTGIECTGACTAPANTCGAANGTESGCQFTKLAGGGTCNNAPAPPRACAIDKCVSPKTCSSGDCIDTTVPPPVGGQTLSLSVGLSGVGNTGDRKNPNASSLSNKSPVKNKIAAIVTLFSGDTQFKSPINAELIYTPSSGKYEGEVGLGTARDGDVTLQVVTTVKVSTPGHLRKGVDVTIAAGKTPVSVNLFAGDLNADGELSIVDYGIFISCSIFGKDNKQACGGKELDADFNMDGNVDQADYNLFLREYGATGE